MQSQEAAGLHQRPAKAHHSGGWMAVEAFEGILGLAAPGWGWGLLPVRQGQKGQGCSQVVQPQTVQLPRLRRMARWKPKGLSKRLEVKYHRQNQLLLDQVRN